MHKQTWVLSSQKWFDFNIELGESSPKNLAKNDIFADISDKEKDAAKPRVIVLLDSEKAMYEPLVKLILYVMWILSQVLKLIKGVKLTW